MIVSSNASKQAWLYASEHGELIADIMILEPRQHLAMLRRHPDNDFRLGLFVPTKQQNESEREREQTALKARGKSHTMTMRAKCRAEPWSNEEHFALSSRAVSRRAA